MTNETLGFWLVTAVACFLCLWVAHLIRANGRLIARLQNLAARNFEKLSIIAELSAENAKLMKQIETKPEVPETSV